MTWSDLDLSYLVRQLALVSTVALLPLLVFAVVSSLRRHLMPVGALAIVALTATGVWICARRSLELWGAGPPAAPPVRIGPSPFAVVDLLAFFALVTWAPLFVALASMWWWRVVRSFRVSLTYCVLGSLWCGFWQTGALLAFEHSHEDTQWTDGFGALGWAQVREGMSRSQVEALVGPPLPTSLQPKFLPNALFWVRNNSAGYWAALTFRDGVVVEKRWWYSD